MPLLFQTVLVLTHVGVAMNFVVVARSEVQGGVREP